MKEEVKTIRLVIENALPAATFNNRRRIIFPAPSLPATAVRVRFFFPRSVLWCTCRWWNHCLDLIGCAPQFIFFFGEKFRPNLHIPLKAAVIFGLFAGLGVAIFRWKVDQWIQHILLYSPLKFNVIKLIPWISIELKRFFGARNLNLAPHFELLWSETNEKALDSSGRNRSASCSQLWRWLEPCAASGMRTMFRH